MPDPAEDAELVVAARSGDRDAFAAIYDRYADRIHDFCTSTLRNRAEAADVMQETFLVAYERLGQLREPSRLKPWLYAIAYHASLKRHRAGARMEEAEPEMDEMISTDASPEEEYSRGELSEFVWQAAAGLGERDRALLDLHLRQGLDGKDLAAAVGVAPSHVYVMMNRLRTQVERSLGALLVARTGRRRCPELAGILVGWDGRLTPALRAKVVRHVDGCEVCSDRRTAALSPLALLAAVPLIPAPAHLRDTVLGKTQLAAATHAAGGGASAGSGWSFDGDGFPRSEEHPDDVGDLGDSDQDADDDHDVVVDAPLTPAVSPPPTSPVPLVAAAANEGPRRHKRRLVVAAVAAAIVLAGGTTAFLAAADDQPGPVTPVAVVGTSPTSGPATTGPADTATGTGTATVPSNEARATPTTTNTIPLAAPGIPPSPTPPAAPGRLTTSPAMLDFGASSTSQPLVVRNIGGRDLHFTAVSSSAALTVTPAAGTLAGGGSATLTVAFDRTVVAAGPFVAHIAVSSNGGSADIALSALVAPTIPKAGPTIARATASQSTIYTPACAAKPRVAGLQTTSGVTAEVVSATPMASVTLNWQAPASGAGSAPMNGNGSTWTGTLGPFNTAGTVQWWVTAVDSSGGTAKSPQQSITVVSC